MEGLEVVKQGGEELNTQKVQFSKDSKWLFVCCGCHVKVFSYSSKQIVYNLIHHTASVTATALNPKNQLQLFTSSLDGHLALWDYSDGALLRVTKFSTPIYKFGIRPVGQEPSFFFVIQKNSEMVLVSLSSNTISERSESDVPSNQLADADYYLHLGKEAPDFAFTYEGSCVVSYRKKKLLVYDLDTSTHYNYSSHFTITTVDCHPTKMCIATGNKRGEIQLWYDFAKEGSKVVTTTFHWHAHSVADVCFTTDGTYLLSGGEESVLVLWQLDTHKKQFRPRLGSPITRLGCSPGDTYFTVSLQNNVVRLVSGLDTEVEYTLGGLRKAYTQDINENGIKTGLVLCSRSNSLVLNSSPGFLQFYDPTSDSMVGELDVTNLNYVSRPDDVPLVLTTVDHAAFSPDGQWLATIEGRDNRKTASELRMKFWEFSPQHQTYVLNTCVDPPHDQQVTSLIFQPSKPHPTSSLTSSRQPSSPPLHYMVVTTSMDGRFKTWVLVDDEEEVGKKDKDKDITSSWVCRSVGYYHSLPCLGAAFSQDGSLLALNFKKCLTLWDPFSCELMKTFTAPFPNEDIKHIVFGCQASSRYLMATTCSCLQVWNLLTCSVVWCLKTKIDCLLSDPFSHVSVAFVPSDNGLTTNLYIFDPSSPTPIAVYNSITSNNVRSAVFIPQTEIDFKSTLYFMDDTQLLYALKKPMDEEEQRKPVLGDQREQTQSQKAFTEIFGDEKYAPSSQESPSHDEATSLVLPKTHSSLLNAPPHVLPPMSSLCRHFVKTLLSSTQSRLKEGSPSSEDQDSESDVDESHDHENSSKEGEDADSEKKDSSHPVHKTKASEPMEVEGGGGEDLKKVRERDDQVGNYDWLVESLRCLRIAQK